MDSEPVADHIVLYNDQSTESEPLGHGVDEDEQIKSNNYRGLTTEKLCRICAQETEELIPIFGEEGKQHNLLEKIHIHLPIKVTEDDLLPVSVCYRCACKLEECHKFVIVCKEGNDILLAKLGYDGYIFYEDSDKEDPNDDNSGKENANDNSDIKENANDDNSEKENTDNSNSGKENIDNNNCEQENIHNNSSVKENANDDNAVTENNAEKEKTNNSNKAEKETIDNNNSEKENIHNNNSVKENANDDNAVTENINDDDNDKENTDDNNEEVIHSDSAIVQVDETPAYTVEDIPIDIVFETHAEDFRERNNSFNGTIKYEIESPFINSAYNDNPYNGINNNGHTNSYCDGKKYNVPSMDLLVPEILINTDESLQDGRSDILHSITNGEFDDNLVDEEVYVQSSEIGDISPKPDENVQYITNGKELKHSKTNGNEKKNGVRKAKKKTKFKVYVVKLTNSKNLPHDVQVSKAIELLNKQKEDKFTIKNKSNGQLLEGGPIDSISLPIDKHIKYSLTNESTNMKVQSNDDIADNDHSFVNPKHDVKSVMDKDNLIQNHVICTITEDNQISNICTSKEMHLGSPTDYSRENYVFLSSTQTGTDAAFTEIMEKKEDYKENVEISNVINVNVEQNNPVMCMKVSKEFKEVENFLKSEIVNTIQQIVATGNEVLSKAPVKKIKKKVWKCKTCKATLHTKQDIDLHRQLHPLTKLHCRLCKKQFSNRHDLEKHKDMHRNDLSFICEYCGKSFQIQSALTRHLITHGILSKMYECPDCGKTYGTKSGYECHLTSHSDKSAYLCDVCGKFVKHISNFRVHRRVHIDPECRKRFPCDTCGKKYQSRFRLLEHRRMHTNEFPYSCPTCGKQFQRIGLLAQHTEIHVNARRHKCYICGKRFNRRGNMLMHVKRHQQPHVCKICLKTFTSFVELLSHRKGHTQQDIDQAIMPRVKVYGENMFKCEVCGKILSNKVSLRSHMLLHSGNKPYICNVCGKGFAVKSSLKYHTYRHTGEKPFVCQFCNAGFQMKQSLIIHERLHTGESPFKCDLCNKSFRSKVNLNQHAVVHSDERPFNCTHCDKGFRRRDTLDTHLRTHTGERPYACEVCDRRFKQKGDCNKHQRNHFKESRLILETLPLVTGEEYTLVENCDTIINIDGI